MTLWRGIDSAVKRGCWKVGCEIEDGWRHHGVVDEGNEGSGKKVGCKKFLQENPVLFSRVQATSLSIGKDNLPTSCYPKHF